MISDSGDWNINEIQEWLDSDVEPDDMGLLEGMSYTPYGGHQSSSMNGFPTRIVTGLD